MNQRFQISESRRTEPGWPIYPDSTRERTISHDIEIRGHSVHYERNGRISMPGEERMRNRRQVANRYAASGSASVVVFGARTNVAGSTVAGRAIHLRVPDLS